MKAALILAICTALFIPQKVWPDTAYQCEECEECCPSKGPSWEFAQDILYWKAHEGRMQFTSRPEPLATTNDFTFGSLVSPHFKWDIGIRERLCYRPCTWSWDFALEWVYIRNKASGSLETDGTSGMSPAWSLLQDTSSSDFVFDSSLTWAVVLNVVDAIATYRYQPFCWFYLSPYIGLKGAGIDQDFKVKYNGGSLISELKEKMDNDFFGIGPEVGIKPLFVLGNQWNIYSFFDYSPLIGRFTAKQDAEYTEADFYHRTRHYWKIANVIDVGAGLEWHMCFCQDRYGLAIRAGGEYHNFFSQNRLKGGPLHLLSGNRNLTFIGGTFSAIFSF